MAINMSSLAASVGSQPFVFARIVGSKPPLLASPSDLVCRSLQLGARGVPSHQVRRTFAPVHLIVNLGRTLMRPLLVKRQTTRPSESDAITSGHVWLKSLR